MARMSASLADAVWVKVLPGAEASVCSLTLTRVYWIENPPRTVVFPSPNQGTCHAKPTAGPKLFLSRRRMLLFGLVVSGPTNSMEVTLLGSHVEVGSSADCVTPFLQSRGTPPGGIAAPVP